MGSPLPTPPPQPVLGAAESRSRRHRDDPPRTVAPLSVRDVCHGLGIAPRTFYRALPELLRLGLRELPRVSRRRLFDAASFASLCARYGTGARHVIGNPLR